jgi:hypothetical protein
MSFLRIAYILLIAAVVALRLVYASPSVSASDQLKMVDGAGRASDVQAEMGAQDSDSAHLVTGRSVAVPISRANDSVNDAERKPREGLGAMGFARR